MQEGTNQPEFSEVSPVKVIGSIRFDNIFTLKVFNTFILLRTQGKKKHIMAFKISPVPTQEEYDAHMEIVYSHLKLRQLQQKINGQIGASDASLSNSMMHGRWTWYPGGRCHQLRREVLGNKNYDSSLGEELGLPAGL